MTADRFDHLCTDPKCCSYKQRTYARCCACHKTRETMMLERIAELEAAPLSDRDGLLLYVLDDAGCEVEVR